MLLAGLDPPELLQTSDLNQLPLETFLRTGTKLSMIILLNHQWWLWPFWLGKILRSGKRICRIKYRNKDCMPGHAVCVTIVTDKISCEWSDLWSDWIKDNEWVMIADQSVPSAVYFQSFAAWRVCYFDFPRFLWNNVEKSTSNCLIVPTMEHARKSRCIAEVDSFIYLEKNDPLVVSHFCRRIDIVHLSQLWVWKAPIWLNGPILDWASCLVVP